jgi:hypothetical protein
MSAPAARLFVFALLLAACSRAPVVPERDAAPDRALPPAAPGPKDAAADLTDAASDLAAPPAARSGGHRPPAEPRSAAGGFKIEGNISRSDVERILAIGKPKLRGCYDKEHAGNPALHGKVSFRLTVDDRGRVSLGEVVASTLGGGDPEMCMIEALRDLKFAPPAGGGESKLSFQMAFGP